MLKLKTGSTSEFANKGSSSFGSMGWCAQLVPRYLWVQGSPSPGHINVAVPHSTVLHSHQSSHCAAPPTHHRFPWGVFFAVLIEAVHVSPRFSECNLGTSQRAPGNLVPQCVNGFAFCLLSLRMPSLFQWISSDFIQEAVPRYQTTHGGFHYSWWQDDNLRIVEPTQSSTVRRHLWTIQNGFKTSLSMLKNLQHDAPWPGERFTSQVLEAGRSRS